MPVLSAPGGRNTSYQQVVGTSNTKSVSNNNTLTEALTQTVDGRFGPFPSFDGGATFQTTSTISDAVNSSLTKLKQDSQTQNIPEAGGTAWQFQMLAKQPHPSCSPSSQLTRTKEFVTTQGGTGTKPCCPPGTSCSNTSPRYAGCEGGSLCDENVAPTNQQGTSQYCSLSR